MQYNSILTISASWQCICLNDRLAGHRDRKDERATNISRLLIIVEYQLTTEHIPFENFHIFLSDPFFKPLPFSNIQSFLILSFSNVPQIDRQSWPEGITDAANGIKFALSIHPSYCGDVCQVNVDVGRSNGLPRNVYQISTLKQLCKNGYCLWYLSLLDQCPVTHICTSKLDHHWFRKWLVFSSTPGHYLKQCSNSVNWTLGKKIHWKSYQNWTTVIQENEFENVACKTAAILSWNTTAK